MSTHPSLDSATAALSELVRSTTDEQLTAPTPCPDYSVGDLLDHINGLSIAFTWAAEKSTPESARGQQPQPGSAARLPENWRDVIPQRLQALTEAWKAPEAWEGMTEAGSVELPGEVGGLVALNEVVIHGWDLAKGTGRAFDPGEEAVAILQGFTAQFDPKGDGAFGPWVEVPESAPHLDQVIGKTGRNPGWTA